MCVHFVLFIFVLDSLLLALSISSTLARLPIALFYYLPSPSPEHLPACTHLNYLTLIVYYLNACPFAPRFVSLCP